jgi:hypothetical protein
MKRNEKDNRDSRRDLSNDFVHALAADWKEHGTKTIEQVREKTPEKYCELISKVVPREMLIASDGTAATDINGPKTSRDIADHLLGDVGLSHPSDRDRERALEAYDALIASLESIRDQALN